jgi:hypothetical protein
MRTGFDNWGSLTAQEAREQPHPHENLATCSLSRAHTLARAGMTTPTLARWHPPPPAAVAPAARLLPLPPTARAPRRRHPRRAATVVTPRAFGRADFDGFVRRAWRSANVGAERLSFEARLAAQRLDGRYAVSRRLAEAARAARVRAVEIDAELGIGRRWRSFSVDFSRNWPRVPIRCTSSPFPAIYSTLRVLISA